MTRHKESGKVCEALGIVKLRVGKDSTSIDSRDLLELICSQVIVVEVLSITCQQQLRAILYELAVIDWQIGQQQCLNLCRGQLLAHLEYLSFAI